MGSKSNYLENKVLNWALKGTATGAWSGVWVGLFNVEPTDAFDPSNNGVNGTECSGGNYARVQVTGGSAFTTATTGSSSNGGTVTFPTATDDWKTGLDTEIVAFGLFDAATTGNMFYWGTISPHKTILNGDTASFGTGALVVTEE